ncbi:MAG: hypothetical protein QOE71_6, partial [Pseudonocardiales bacterium]|nr:hypothetical protein [Pseudonocardiales bacterium]
MSDTEPFPGARPVTTYVGHGRSRRLLRSHGFWVAVFGLLLGVGLAWLLVTGLLAGREVRKADSAINDARASISAGDLTTAIGHADQIRAHAHRAHEFTTGPAWWIASRIPLLGKPVVSVRGCA